MIDIHSLEENERLDLTNLLKQSGSEDKHEALTAQHALAAALTTPLRQGVLTGDNISQIFTPEVFDVNARIEYPIDFYRADNAHEFSAYVIPNWGRIPERMVAGDMLQVPTYDIGSSIDWLLRYSREARWNIIARALEVMEAGFTYKLNTDGWHTLLAAGFDRNILISDANAATGQFTKRLVSLMKLVMRRNSGGNASSINRGQLTHLFVSPEALEDMRNWGVDEVDEITRNQIYNAADNGEATIYGVKIIALDELGEGQEYQTYYEEVIADGAANDGMASGDEEIVIGLDLSPSNRDSFVMPIREELQIFEDENLHRQRRQGFYGWMSPGFGILNSSRILLGSI